MTCVMRIRWYGAIIFAGVVAAAGVCDAGPQLQAAAFREGSDIVMVVLGEELPTLKRLSLIFEYDPAQMNPALGMVSSPLPSAAFGALIDTAARRLSIEIVATTSLSIAEGATIATIRMPAGASADAQKAIRLTEAVGIDAKGGQFTPAIGSTSAGRGFIALRAAAPEQLSRRDAAIITLNGRSVGVARTAASSVRIQARAVCLPAWMGRN